ncbi:MAG: hypothetical protein R3275_07060 [Saprospiraceae bacterium]|nr:hypothetical protein [Saprospiraceae bacterium]
MKQLLYPLLLGIGCLILFSCCSDKTFSKVSYFSPSYQDSIKSLSRTPDILGSIIPNGQTALYYLMIRRDPIFLDGELTFQLTATYNTSDQISQYSYFVFDQYNRVYYNTASINNILSDSTLEISVSDTIVVDEESNESNYHALLGKYNLKGDTVFMELEKRGNSETIKLWGEVENDHLVLNYVEIERTTFPALRQVDLEGNTVRGSEERKRRIYELRGMFSIDPLKFKLSTELQPILTCRAYSSSP